MSDKNDCGELKLGHCATGAIRVLVLPRDRRQKTPLVSTTNGCDEPYSSQEEGIPRVTGINMNPFPGPNMKHPPETMVDKRDSPTSLGTDNGGVYYERGMGFYSTPAHFNP